MVERRTIQARAGIFPRCCRIVGLGLAACATATAVPAVAVADVPPDVSQSSLSCVDTNGGALRPGDDLTCLLAVRMGFGTEAGSIAATVSLPDTVEFVSAPFGGDYDATTRTIGWDEQAIGLIFAGQQRSKTFHLSLDVGLASDTPVGVTGSITAIGDIDGAVVQQALASTPLKVSPPVADLAASTLACADVNGGTLLPGEEVSCDLDVTDAAAHEDAAFLKSTISLPGTGWLSGGASATAGVATFDESLVGLVQTGTSKVVNAHFVVAPTALGGATITPTAFISGASSPSLTGVIQNVLGNQLAISPGPARLVLSSLSCSDTNSGLLLTGDDVTCLVAVRPSAGYEDVTGVSADVSIPTDTEWASGGDSHDSSSVSFVGSLGDIAAGSTKTVAFHLLVRSNAPVGTSIHPAGQLNAMSVPLGGPLQQDLDGNKLVVDPRPEALIPIVPPVVPISVAPSETPVVKPPVAAAYKLKARTIRIRLRRGHRRPKHLWRGGRRSFVYVKKFVTRTPSGTKIIRKVTVPKRGKWAPKRGKVRIKGTRLTYTLTKGRKAKDRFHYTVTDITGKKATGTVIVNREAKKKRKP